MNGWQGFTMSQSGRPPSFPHIFDIHRKIFVCVRGCVCVCFREREGYRNPLLCLQVQGLAAEEREEKRGEDCVWNCPSVALVVLSHFISATAAFFSPIYLPSDYSSPLSELEKHSHSHHGWLNTIANLSPPTYPAHAISSLNSTLRLNALLISYPLLNLVIFVQSTETLPRFISFSVCSLKATFCNLSQC